MGLGKVSEDTNTRHCWLAAGVVAVVAILLELGGKSVRDALSYDRDAVAAGQLWRLVTGHFVHLGWSHLVLNVLGLALVAWLVGRTFNLLTWLYTGLATIVAIDAGFWLLNPKLAWYVGLSGLEHGLLTAGLFVGIAARRDREATILAVLVLAKLCWEQIVGPLPGSESTSGGAVIVDAHLYGTIGGLVAGILAWRRVRTAASI